MNLAWMQKSCILRLLAVSVFSLCLVACQSEKKVEFDVEAGDASNTLKSFARQAGVEILMDEGELEGVTTHPITGTMKAPDALQKMISGTGLIFSRDEETSAFAVSFPRRE